MVRILRRGLLILTLFLFCILPQIYTFISRDEFFPWSSFPMYSGLDTGENLYLLSAYFVSSDGVEIPVEASITVRPKYEYRSRFNVQEAWSRNVNSAETKNLEMFAKIFEDDLGEKKNSYTSVKFYFEYWKKFSGPTRYQPDERKMVYERLFNL